MIADHTGESQPRHHSEPRAHHLHRGHQWERKDRGPQRSIPKRRPSDRVSRNSRRIVVGSAGNQAGTQISEESSKTARDDSMMMFALRVIRQTSTGSSFASVPRMRAASPTATI